MSSLGLGLAQPKVELPQNGSSGRQHLGVSINWAPKKFKNFFIFCIEKSIFFQCMLMMWEHVPNSMTEWYMCHHKSVRLLRWSTTLA